MTRILIALLATASFAALTAGCSSSSNADDMPTEYQRITSGGRVYSLDEVVGLGFRSAKEYPVDGLDGALSSSYGVRTNSIGQVTRYEVRVYPSHQTALEPGVRFAEDSAGPNAVITTGGGALWEGNLRERRRVAGGTSSGASIPAYQDYFIYSNLVVLCGGGLVIESQDNCNDFIAAIESLN